MYKIALFATACTLAAVAAFDPITVVAGTTSYVLTGTQVAVAVASLGALALAAEGLILAELSRGKRSAGEEPLMKLDPLFDSIAAVDVADCGKLLVCHVTAQEPQSLSVDESRIARFFQQYKGKVRYHYIPILSLHSRYVKVVVFWTLGVSDPCGFGPFEFWNLWVLDTWVFGPLGVLTLFYIPTLLLHSRYQFHIFSNIFRLTPSTPKPNTCWLPKLAPTSALRSVNDNTSSAPTPPTSWVISSRPNLIVEVS